VKKSHLRLDQRGSYLEVDLKRIESRKLIEQDESTCEKIESQMLVTAVTELWR